MTLAVAKKFGRSIFMCSDTMVTDLRSGFTGWQDWTLKTHILHPQACVSFAGATEHALQTISKFSQSGARNLTQTLRYFELAHLENPSTEFILATNITDPYIFEIRDRQITLTDSAWIGSSAGYSLFQQSWNENVGQTFDANRIASQLVKLPIENGGHYLMVREAMRFAMNNSPVPCVGGLLTCVALDCTGESYFYGNELFEYLGSVETFFKDPGTALEQDPAYAFKIESSAEGGFSCCNIPAKLSDGRPTMAAYLPQGRFGIIFSSSSDYGTNTLVNNVTAIDFESQCRSAGILFTDFSPDLADIKVGEMIGDKAPLASGSGPTPAVFPQLFEQIQMSRKR